MTTENETIEYCYCTTGCGLHAPRSEFRMSSGESFCAPCRALSTRGASAQFTDRHG